MSLVFKRLGFAALRGLLRIRVVASVTWWYWIWHDANDGWEVWIVGLVNGCIGRLEGVVCAWFMMESMAWM